MKTQIKKTYSGVYVGQLKHEIKRLEGQVREAKNDSRDAMEAVLLIVDSPIYDKCPRCGVIHTTPECANCGFDYDYWEREDN
jgi:hypothetical protein